MTTIHLGVEELIARQREASMQRSVRHAWHLTDFRRQTRRPQLAEHRLQLPTWADELVELSTAQARWAML